MKNKNILITVLTIFVCFVLVGCGEKNSSMLNEQSSVNVSGEVLSSTENTETIPDGVLSSTENEESVPSEPEIGTRNNPYVLNADLELTIESTKNNDSTTWVLSNFETYYERSSKGTAEIENLMFDCSLITATDSNKAYEVNDYIIIKQVTDDMEELGGYSLYAITLDEDGKPIRQKESLSPRLYTESVTKAGIIPYRQGLSGLDTAPSIKYYVIYYLEKAGSIYNWCNTPIWISNTENANE